MSVAAPVDSGERLQHVDALRGFALLGILLVNMDLHSAPGGMPVPEETHHYVASSLVTFFAESKFYPLFSMLFGFGLAIQSGRTDHRGWFALRWTRRQAALLVFGLAHGLLIWPGDILSTYAVVGMLALPFMLVPPRWVPWIGGAVWGLGTLFWTGIIGLSAIIMTLSPDGFEAQSAAGIAGAEEAIRVYSSGTFFELLKQRAIDYLQIFVVAAITGHVIFAMFLFGLWAGATGVLRDLAASRPFLERAMMGGIAFGLPFSAAMVYLAPAVALETFDWRFAVYLFAGMLGGPALAMGWAGAFLRFAGPALIRLLAPAGRMALSNYLGQSLICAAIFQSWGLGLYGSTGDATDVALAFAIFGAQLALSHVWMRNFRFGPMEWLWRAITYLTIPPMR